MLRVAGGPTPNNPWMLLLHQWCSIGWAPTPSPQVATHPPSWAVGAGSGGGAGDGTPRRAKGAAARQPHDRRPRNCIYFCPRSQLRGEHHGFWAATLPSPRAQLIRGAALPQASSVFPCDPPLPKPLHC